MGDARRRHGYLKGAAMKAMAGAAALLVGTALMGSAALAGVDPTAPPSTEEPTTTTLAPPTTVAAVPQGPGVAVVSAFTKVFNPDTIVPGDTSTLTFRIEGDATGLGFTDTLPTGVTVETTAATPQCVAGVVAASAGSSSITFSGGTSTVATPCTFDVVVTSSTPGDHVNTTGPLSSVPPPAGTPLTASDTLTVLPAFSKVFSPAQISTGAISTLTYTVGNLNSNAATNRSFTGLAFNDTLPTNLVVAAVPTESTTCGGTWAPTAGSGALSFTGGTVAENTECTISVNVTSSIAGTYTSTSTALTSNAGTGQTATATLTVTTVTATPVATQSAPTGPALAATGGSTTTLLTAIGTFILLFGALLVYGSSQRRRLAQH